MTNIKKSFSKNSQEQKKFDSHIFLCCSIEPCLYSATSRSMQMRLADNVGLPLFRLETFEHLIVSVWLELVLLQTINHRTVVLFIYKSNSIYLARDPLVILNAQP